MHLRDDLKGWHRSARFRYPDVMTDTPEPKPPALALSPAAAALKPKAPLPGGRPAPAGPVPETGGPKGPEPTRFGDWERKGRCSDF
jgi:hypothetical protein